MRPLWRAGVSVAALDDMRASEDPQDICGVSLPEAFVALAQREPGEALRCARTVLSFADTLGMTQDVMQWAWPLAARLAYQLADTALAGELLELLDARQPGQLSPLLRAERELAVARLVAARPDLARPDFARPDVAGVADGEVAAAEAFAAAIRGLREHGTPYHLAHGLLDYAEFLAVAEDSTTSPEAVVAEATDIAGRLRCQPLLDRAVKGIQAGPISV